MSTHARRYHQRAPRYVLRPLDNSIMRFKGEEALLSPAQMMNLSESGLAFTMGGPEIPYLHERLLVEFTIPGKQQIACYADVIRVEPHKTWHPEHGTTFSIKVGIHFHSLPEPYRRALRTSLYERVHPEEYFDDAGEMSMVTRAVNFTIATLGLLALFGGLQYAPVQILEMFWK